MGGEFFTYTPLYIFYSSLNSFDPDEVYMQVIIPFFKN